MPSPLTRNASPSGDLHRPPGRLTASPPLYVQIAESLLDEIESGQLRPGDRLPPERDLSGTLGVNRLTLRRALQVLEGRGLLNRRQGAGTYIAEPKIERQAGRVFSFTQGMLERGFVPGTRLVAIERRPVETSTARHLQLTVSAPVYVIVRLRLVNQEAVMIENYTIPADRFPHLEQWDLERRSVYEVMEQEYGVTPRRARQSLEPVVSTEYEAKLLGISPGAPLMLERRLSYDPQDVPVEYGRDLYRGDRFRFTTEAAPMDRALPPRR